MQQEMDTQSDFGRAYSPDTVSSSSSSTTNLGAQHRFRSTAQHRQHPYIIPRRKPSAQKPRRVSENLIPDLTGLIARCNPYPITGGTYGNIYKCIYHGPEGDVEVAVKAIRPQFLSAEKLRRELGIWKRLRHSNILKFMGTTSDFGPSTALVAPWMTNGTLTSFLDLNNETLTLHDRLLLLRDIAAGLDYLHTFSLTQDGHTNLNPIVHGDLTGTNVLIDSDRKAYLADFGLSGTFKKLTGMTYLAKLTCQPGAVRWAAPELLSGEESTFVATTQSDMYSFGNIMLQVLTGNVPWCHLTRDFQISYQVVIKGKIHPRPNDVHVTDQHWNFMARCWSMSFTDRPPAKEAVQFVGSALHTSTSPKSLTLSTDDDDERTRSASPQVPTSDERTPNTSPQTPTLSISSNERHFDIARNDHLRENSDARLPVMQDIDSPLDARENYPGVILPASPFTTYTTSLEPSSKTPYRYYDSELSDDEYGFESSDDECPSMDEDATKEEMRPVKKQLKQLKLTGEDMPRDYKIAILKDSLVTIGRRIEIVLQNKHAAGEDRERWRRHLWVFVTLFWPKKVKASKLEDMCARAVKRAALRASAEASTSAKKPRPSTLWPEAGDMSNEVGGSELSGGSKLKVCIDEEGREVIDLTVE